VSLGKWANEEIRSKEQARAIYDRFRQAVREGRAVTIAEDAGGPMTFVRFADIYIDRYVKPNSLTSADTIEYRMGAFRAYFGAKPLTDIRTADIEDFVAALKAPAVLSNNQKTARVRRPATINRYLSLLRHMFNWAEGRQYIDGTPFRRGNTSLVKQEHEDNKTSSADHPRPGTAVAESRGGTPETSHHCRARHGGAAWGDAGLDLGRCRRASGMGTIPRRDDEGR
jgi:hypothetical protein